MEIATGDDGGAGEQIVVRQYNTSSTITNEATLLDKSGNTTFPKNVTATKFIGALQYKRRNNYKICSKPWY